MSITIISFILRLTAAMNTSIKADPNHADPAIPIADPIELAARPKMGAPRMKMATPRLAPELIPRTYGPARGFLKRVCISRPLNDKATPVATATTAFTNLISLTILAVVGSTSPPTRALHTSDKGILTAPIATSRIKSNRRVTDNTANNIVFLLFIRTIPVFCNK
jgi:hypothetical protein